MKRGAHEAVDEREVTRSERGRDGLAVCAHAGEGVVQLPEVDALGILWKPQHGAHVMVRYQQLCVRQILYACMVQS